VNFIHNFCEVKYVNSDLCLGKDREVVNVSTSMQEVAEEVNAWIERMGKEYTRVYGPFAVWMRRVEEKGALDAKTKELISVALAVATQCRWCIAVHTNAALDAGATKNQVMEACFVACLFRGAPSCMYSQLVMKAIEEHQSRAFNP
jgi:AhpD family alkylhydroperoxidase